MSETDPAARAFEDLCAEMTVLRRSVEALPQAWRDNRSPDYTEDLARVVKAMNAVGARMEAIEANPTLKMTPQAYGQWIRQAGISASQEMQAAFQKAIGEVQDERQELAHIIGQSRQQDRQNWWLLGVGLACLVVGIGLSPVLAYLLPSSIGTRVASFIVGEKDRWNSGAMMMAVSNPEGWQRVREDSQLVEANRDRITACQKAVSGQEKTQKPCVIIVPAEQE
ncbi:hypothetical protein NBRC3280_2637 [Acetobacter pasteurianus NBRC 3280]|uniref:Uncharacterized protein n=2 Tax=Acetobacteraceae TaxID=433 RepID=A0A0D6PWN2_KOMEU|nr:MULTISPECIES: DUF6118 family protein [Acetobacteraceae]GAN95589.1 hypothetical protein Geu3261_0030_006 [Komagataeibacter europaeus NBRC 3261]GCD60471.1 hypothetical protein NBRC3277_3046 [Acetobacter pasteurianus NBRC 3277]GCD64224.1 hypothetical protein NBRC3278_3317 [Acetobacter pasteurianus NBRC 3278]GCD70002.1 hypothetical protein NBRC3280_2637 [Acetobacter pasteurianus NBRC 3280]